MKLLLIGNFLALSSSSIAMIPLGTVFNGIFPLGVAWAILLSLKRLPGLALSPLYVRYADRNGAPKTVAALLAGTSLSMFAIFALSGGDSSSVWIILVLYTIFQALLTSIELLFPAILIHEGEARNQFSNWQLVLALASVVTVMLGGVLSDTFKPSTVLGISAVLSTLSAALWAFRAVRAPLKVRHAVDVEVIHGSWRKLLNTKVIWYISLRAFCFGIINPLIAVTVISVNKSSDSALGMVFLILGVVGMGGAFVARHLLMHSRRTLLIVFIELVSIALAAIFQSLTAFVVLVAISSFCNSLLETHIMADFVERHKASANLASTVYNASYVFALVIGYFTGALIVGPMQPAGRGLFFAILIGAVMFIMRSEVRLEVKA